MIKEGFTERGSVRLHYLLSEGSGDLTPLVYVPGSLGSAGDFRKEMLRLDPRTTVSVSPRGTGASGTPYHGYALGDRIADLEAVLLRLRPGTACLMAFSAGVPVVLSYAISQPDKVRALIILDYPAVSRPYSEDWVEQAMPFARQRGIPEHVLQSMARDSALVELWEDLLERSDVHAGLCSLCSR